MVEPRAFAYSLCFYFIVALSCFAVVTPSKALAQASGDQCTLGKPAKLFKRAKGKAFRFKLKSGDVVTLVQQKSARWKVTSARGVKGFIKVRHMNRVCTYSTPNSEKAKEEVPVEPPVVSPAPAPPEPVEKPVEPAQDKPVAEPVQEAPTPPQEIEPPPTPLQPEIEKPAEPAPPVQPEPKLKEAEPDPEPSEQVKVPEVSAVVVPEDPSTDWQLGEIPTLAYVSLGTGAVAFGVAGYFGLEMQSNADIANELDYGSHNAAQKAQGQALIANIALGVGALGMATGLYLVLDSMFWSDDSVEKESEPNTPEVDGVAVVPVDEGVVVQVGGSF